LPHPGKDTILIVRKGHMDMTVVKYDGPKGHKKLKPTFLNIQTKDVAPVRLSSLRIDLPFERDRLA
jgi:hypothetical protein